MTKDQILLEIERSRNALARDYAATKFELDPRNKLTASIRTRPYIWIAGAAALGWLLAGPKTKTRIVQKDGKKTVGKPKGRPALGIFGILLAAFKLSLPMLKPAFSAYAARRFAEMASKLAG